MDNICPGCVEKALEFWFILNKKHTLIPLLRSRTSNISNYGTTSELCAICGNNIGVCIDCYIAEISKWINKDYALLSIEINDLKENLKNLTSKIELKVF